MSAQIVKTQYAILVALAMAIASPLGAAQSPPGALDLSGFEGSVRLEHSPTGEARVRTDGWTLVERQGALVLQAQPVYQASSSACGSIFDRTSFLASTGRNKDRGGKAAKVEIAIPASMRVLASQFSGSLESNVALVDPHLDVSSGTLSLVQILGGELAINGPGAIKIEQAAGRLRVGVDGAGSIQVRHGRIDHLTAAVRGSGSIHHDGIARRAVLIANEAGEIRIGQLVEPIRIEQAGSASITIACRGTACDPR